MPAAELGLDVPFHVPGNPTARLLLATVVEMPNRHLNCHPSPRPKGWVDVLNRMLPLAFVLPVPTPSRRRLVKAFVVDLARAAVPAAVWAQQIGRASCRERVCQSV